ncbi:UDP-3-O-(3-hydroxymyristoyl)glucosamine N-acyltransferase [Thiohalomonas denitrificans]|uniref:UDP-3-O-acylglucosamine N-acyltransferase n=1 Tax=Thiohalomonas denitrificans TaxID=415747 RepID=A0A1G5Q2J6_9GAMM|nr:UDP-3-O-(3-hydroxymyristoyl)glucosamine N-acyltransferase [Thiohalomonas denitrificans]SCZ55848.1 UDP-3-O-[3-hydroxymyristoyl] glucosamine N-acyltransferase [Thiohalomonas denitrificans]
MEYSLTALAEVAGARLEGEPSLRIGSIGTLANAHEGQIAFLSNPKYRNQLSDTRASAVILDEGSLSRCPVAALVADNPYAAFARVTALFDMVDTPEPGRHHTAQIHQSAEVHPDAVVGPNVFVGPRSRIGADVVIGPGCFIDSDCIIEDGTRLAANVSIYHGSDIGRRGVIHAGAVIGSDGFGFAKDAGRWLKVHQLGAVVIGDDVEVGANTTIDRGAVNDTIIEEGVKLDNLIQIAHNVRIGAHTAVAACVGIAGSTVIGKHCAIAGGVGILGHLEIADGVTITAMSLVTKSVKKPGMYSAGVPLEANERWQKNFVRFKQLDDMARRIRSLEKELEELKKG